MICSVFSDSQKAHGSKKKKKKAHTPLIYLLIYLVQHPRKAVTCSGPWGLPTAKSEVVYWSPCSCFSIEPPSMASVNLGKYVFSLYKLFCFKAPLLNCFSQRHRSPSRELEGVGPWDSPSTSPAGQLCFYLFYVLVFWIRLFWGKIQFS